MNTSPIVCCVIVLNENNEILLIKRGKEPYINKWSLISGIGYSKKGMTPIEGVVDEVVGDVTALPFNIKNLFSVQDNSQIVLVFSAQVNKSEVIPVSPYVSELKWFTKNELRNLDNLAFDHEEVLNGYTKIKQQ